MLLGLKFPSEVLHRTWQRDLNTLPSGCQSSDSQLVGLVLTLLAHLFRANYLVVGHHLGPAIINRTDSRLVLFQLIMIRYLGIPLFFDRGYFRSILTEAKGCA